MLAISLLVLLAQVPDAGNCHRDAIVIDTHLDTPQLFLDEGFDLALNAGAGHHVDLKKLEAGGVDAVFWSVWVDPKAHAGRYAHRTLALIDAIVRQTEKHPRLVLATTAAELEAAAKAGKIASLLGIEGGHSIENDLGLLRQYHRLGVRYLTLTWANSNEWADSSGDLKDPKVKHHQGLSPFGREVVREMNRLGMMIDVSHAAEATVDDVLEVTKAPVIASHSSAAALAPVPRNLTDAQLKAIAKNGGVVNVNFWSGFIDSKFLGEYVAKRKALKGPGFERERAMVATIPRPKLSVLLDHFEHIAKVAGPAHVGLGSDFDGIQGLPEGIDSCADLPALTDGLLARGYTPEQVKGFLGGNLLRVMREVEAVAAATR